MTENRWEELGKQGGLNQGKEGPDVMDYSADILPLGRLAGDKASICQVRKVVGNGREAIDP